MHTGRKPTLSSDNMQLLQRVWSLPLKATTINQAVVALNYDVKYVANTPDPYDKYCYCPWYRLKD
jgi:hypothetical protein